MCDGHINKHKTYNIQYAVLYDTENMFGFLQPTSKNRGWLMDPLGENPWWTLLVAVLPALLCTILVFMDQQITAVIINRKEHKLKVRPASTGLHLFVRE